MSNRARFVFAHPFHMPAIGTIVALSVPLAAIAILPTGIGVLLGLAILVCTVLATAAVACRSRRQWSEVQHQFTPMFRPRHLDVVRTRHHR